MKGYNLIESLTREVLRVTELREGYKKLDGMAGVNMKPVLAMMNKALESACVASGSGDTGDMIRAVKELEGFSE